MMILLVQTNKFLAMLPITVMPMVDMHGIKAPKKISVDVLEP